MAVIKDTIEIDGIIDANHHLILNNEDLPIDGPMKVKVIIKLLEKEKSGHPINRLKGKMKKKIDGLEYQKQFRNEWD